MTSATNALPLLIASLLMLVAGLAKKRIDWKPRDKPPRRRKPPPDAFA